MGGLGMGESMRVKGLAVDVWGCDEGKSDTA